VLKTARSYRSKYGLPSHLADDLEATALHVLERTAKDWDPGRGTKYTTFLLASLLPTLRKQAIKLSRRRGVVADDEWEALADDLNVEEDVGNDLRETLERLVRHLPPQERQFVERHGGLGGREPEPLNQIARDLHVHRVSASRIYNRALSRLREALEAEGVDAEALLSTYGMAAA